MAMWVELPFDKEWFNLDLAEKINIQPVNQIGKTEAFNIWALYGGGKCALLHSARTYDLAVNWIRQTLSV